MEPLISVIVPIYNVEKYLNKCIDSIINQTLREIEIILVDDGSTDNCPLIIDEYAKNDNRIIAIHKENGGQGSARNTGLDIARGEYIGFVDSDDWIDLNMYEELYNSIIDSNSDIGICSRNTYWEDYTLKDSIKVNCKIYKGVSNNIIDYIVTDMIYPNALSVVNKLYKRDLIMGKNIKFKEAKYVGSEDALFNYEILIHTSNIVSTSKANYNQLFRAGSTMRSYNKYYMIRLSNLIDNIISVCNDYNVAMIFYIHFMTRYSKLIIEFSEDVEIDLAIEYRLAIQNQNILKCTKNILNDKDKILNSMGYRISGRILLKVKSILLLLGLYNIRVKIEQLV